RCSVNSRRLATEARLVRAALWRRRGMVLLAVLAVAIGASVASALLHVSGDIERKLSRELRALGPNLIVTAAASGPAAPADGGATDGAPGSGLGAPTAPASFLDVDATARRLDAAHVEAAPVLYVAARVRGEVVQIVGAD